MNRSNHTIAAYIGLLSLLLTPLDGQAAEDAPGPSVASQPVQSVDQEVIMPFAPDREIDADRLAKMRGGTDTATSDQTLRGTVGTNTATNVVSGANNISSGSFASASGLPIVIQNSGANVLIQNATIINLQMH